MLLVDVLGYTNLTILTDADKLVEELLVAETTYDVIFLDINTNQKKQMRIKFKWAIV